MGKFLVAGVVQREVIVKADPLPAGEEAGLRRPGNVFNCVGGAAYNTALALQWLGNSVDFLCMTAEEDQGILNQSHSEVCLETDFVLPRLKKTPSAVVVYEGADRCQIFEDPCDLGQAVYDQGLFRERAARAEMLIMSNVEFCRPLIDIGKELRKTVAVNLKRGCVGSQKQDAEDFLKAADILYLNDELLKEEPFEFVKSLAARYRPEIIILGQGAKGVILYDKSRNMIAHYDRVKTHGVVNTLGEGNALFSCFLHFYNLTHDSVYAIKNALLFASYKIGFMGTSNGFLREEELLRWHNLIWRDGR